MGRLDQVVRRLGAACALLLTVMPAAPLHAADRRPAIVVLFVDDSSQSWIRDMSDGVADAMRRQGATSPILYYEYLDSVRFGEPDSRARFRAALKDKYDEGRPLDLVVAVAPDAIAFAREARGELWPGVPLLLTSYTTVVPDSATAEPKTSGLSFEWGFDHALGVMKTVFPNTARIAVVAGASQVERVRQDRTARAIKDAGLAQMEVTGPTLGETLNAVRRLPEQTLVFIAGGQVDASGNVVPTWPLCQAVSAAANRPTLMLGAQFLGCGIVGGLMRDFKKIGEGIGERALAELAGRQTGNEVVPFASFSTLEFDARQLARWQVPEGRLPRGSVVQFREPSLWREYRSEVIVAHVGLVGQSILIAGLLYERRQRLKAEGESRRSLALAAHVDRRAAMTALTGSIAHELSQPLGSILHNAEAGELLLASNRASSAEIREILHEIRAEDARASQIIQRHRTMLKPHQIEKRPIDMHAVVRESLALVAHDAARRRVEIDARLPAASALVMGDHVLLQQVVVNLVINAMDAMAATPEPRRRVTVQDGAAGDFVEISVRDFGPGLSADIAARLFEPFVTTKAEGIGIGLTIARSIIAAHDGSIDARSNSDGGATFRFTLPRLVSQ